MIWSMVRVGALVLAALPAGAETTCSAYADSAMATAMARDAGISMTDVMTSAIRADEERVGFAEVMIVVIDAVYATSITPERAYTVTLKACLKDGGW